MTGHLIAFDLFAGAGGLSLGLDAAGFRTVLAVERSPMAAETYYRNFIGQAAEWKAHSAIPLGEQVERGLAVGTTRQVLDSLDQLNPNVPVTSGVDLIAGGPPCQGFSTAGLRDPRDQRNTLPYEFLEFVSHFQPRAVLIENVAGMAMRFAGSPSTSPAIELVAALNRFGYDARIALLNARDFGVAQHRPRIMIVGFTRSPQDAQWTQEELYLRLPPRTSGWTSVAQVLGDLDDVGYTLPVQAPYPDDLLAAELLRRSVCHSARMSAAPVERPMNHELRIHRPDVRRRFALLLELASVGISGKPIGLSRAEGFSRTSAQRRIRALLESNAGNSSLEGKFDQLAEEIARLATRKHSQRVLQRDRPAPTVMSLPDDMIHFKYPRTLSVREMARLQSFPDSFVFYGNPTTGGLRRRTDVPQYTQVGNSVPPPMGTAIGRYIAQHLA